VGQTQLVYKVGGDMVGFIGENLGKTKGLRYLIFSLSHGFLKIIMGFQWV
jgi:hypothetical protein